MREWGEGTFSATNRIESNRTDAMMTMVLIWIIFLLHPRGGQEWNDELAKLAEYNTRTCLYSHDDCRATEQYRHAGQNIARKSKPNNITVEVTRAIQDLTNKWWQEYVDTNQTVVDSYRKVGEG